MLKNYVTIFWRNLWHQKIYAVLNVLGLTVALTSSLLIFVYVFDEFSYNGFHEKADRIARVYTVVDRDDGPFSDYYTPPQTPALFSEIPEVETVAQFVKAHGPVARHGETLIQSQTIYATENLFEVFSHDFLAGDPATALRDQYSVVLTDSFATILFGREPALGKTVTFFQEGMFDDQPFTVTGVIKNVPHRTSFDLDKVLSIRSHPRYSPENMMLASFVLLREGASLDVVQEKLAGLHEKYFGDRQGTMRLGLQPITAVHLDPPLDREWIPGGGGGNRQSLLILIAVGGFLVLIACVNYVNMATARASRRAREIGVRKVAGASRIQLIGQHLAESTGITGIAFLLAVALAVLCLPILNGVTDKGIELAFLMQTPVLLALAGFALLIGIGAGAPPAILLTAFSPADTLKNPWDGIRGRRFRSVLVVGQFAISVLMIVFALVVFQQLHYIQNKDLGFDRESVIVVDNTTWLRENQQVFLEEVRRQSQVVDAGFVQTFPGRLWNLPNIPFFERPGDVPRPGEPSDAAGRNMDVYRGDDGFLPAMGIDLLAGRNFFEGGHLDTASVLVNAAAVRALGWTDPVGERLYQGQTIGVPDGSGGWQMRFTVREYEVIGVIRDFHHYPLRQEIEPMVVMPPSFPLPTAVIRVTPGDVGGLLSSLGELWRELQPRYPFVYLFVDEEFEATYQKDLHFGRLAGFFTALSILIACLGMVGLAAFTAERRTREVGIRKALGASLHDVLVLLCTDTVKRVVIACLIGLPVGFFLVNKWLENFAYRIEVSVLVFLVAGVAALLFAILSVSSQTLRAATTNPADALRHE